MHKIVTRIKSDRRLKRSQRRRGRFVDAAAATAGVATLAHDCRFVLIMRALQQSRIT
jgi:hypothetical protein